MILEQDMGGAESASDDDFDSSVYARPQRFGALGSDDGEGGERDLDKELQAAVGLGNDPGLELLVELAKRGECDPWDLDVVNLTDTYLQALDEVLDARDLGRVARLIFYAACLIHLKAQAMATRQKQLDYEDALELTLADEFDFEHGDGHGRFSPRLLPGDQPLDYGFLRGDLASGFDPASFLSPREQPVRSRGLTLVDLIFALREYDDRLATRELEIDDEPDFTAEQAMVECVASSHQDDLEGDIDRIRAQLWECLGRHEPLAGVDQRIELDSLITPQRSRAAAFLALLFLAHDEEINLEQPEFYGELFVERGTYFGEIRAGIALEGEAEAHEDEDENDELAEVIEGVFADEADDDEINQPAIPAEAEGGAQ